MSISKYLSHNFIANAAGFGSAISFATTAALWFLGADAHPAAFCTLALGFFFAGMYPTAIATDDDKLRGAWAYNGSISGLCFQAVKALPAEHPSIALLNTISTTLSKIYWGIHNDPSKRQYLGEFLQLLAPTERSLELYARLLTGEVQLAGDTLAEADRRVLPLMVQRAVALHNKMHVNDIAELATAYAEFEVTGATPAASVVVPSVVANATEARAVAEHVAGLAAELHG